MLPCSWRYEGLTWCVSKTRHQRRRKEKELAAGFVPPSPLCSLVERNAAQRRARKRDAGNGEGWFLGAQHVKDCRDRELAGGCSAPARRQGPPDRAGIGTGDRSRRGAISGAEKLSGLRCIALHCIVGATVVRMQAARAGGLASQKERCGSAGRKESQRMHTNLEALDCTI